jgi:hypothetical protein
VPSKQELKAALGLTTSTLTSMVAYTDVNGLQKYFENYEEVKDIRNEVDDMLDRADEFLDSEDCEKLVGIKQDIAR